MAGGTLIVSRAINLFPFFTKLLEGMGFRNVSATEAEKDGLNMVIKELKPQLVLIDAAFYQCSTPYMMGILLKRYPNLNIAVVSIAPYPADLAMCFIVNGVKSFISFYDGVDQFYRGLYSIRDGKVFISQSVQERIEIRKDYPDPAAMLTERQKEVIRLICNGYKELEITDSLHISRRTLDTHKTDIFTALNVRNSNELIRAALALEIVKENEIYFYPKNFAVNPLPIKNKQTGGSNDNQDKKRCVSNGKFKCAV